MHHGFIPKPDIIANRTDSPRDLCTPVTVATSAVAVTPSPTGPSSTVTDLSPSSGRSISTSSLLSDDPIREKVENLKLGVEQLQNQLLLQRLGKKQEGASVLAAFLQEERQENSVLREEVQALRTRLAVAEKAAYCKGKMDKPLPMDFTSPATRQATGLTIAEVLRENELLKEENRQLKVYRSTSVERDNEISRLNKCNAKLKESMTQQTALLQKKLKEAAEMCQQLSGQQDQDPGSQRLHRAPPDFMQFHVNGDQGGLEQENERLKDQVTSLNQQLQDVIDMNTRWQTYNKQRNEHIVQLNQKVRSMEDQLGANAKPLQLSEKQQADIDRLILQYKQKVELAEEEKIKLSDENRELRMQLDQSAAANMEKENTIKTLQEQLTRAQTAFHGSRQNTEHIQMLEHQVQLCTEDFESERHDRERAQARADKLEQELRIVKRQLEQYQGRQMDDILARRRAAMDHYREEYQRQHPGYHPPTQTLVPRGGYQTDCVEEDTVPGDNGEGYDTIDIGPDPVGHFKPGESALQRAEPEDTLECPRCKKEFPVSKHEQLLEHTNECR